MDAPHPPAEDSQAPRCGHRFCKEEDGELVPCVSCGKKIHFSCYDRFLIQKWNLQPLDGTNVACTKHCYRKASSRLGLRPSNDAEGSRRGGWNTDGLNGPSDPHTSMKILLDWWLQQGNYDRFCGKNNEGIRKMDVCRQLANKMTAETKSPRDAKNVFNKISHIKSKFMQAQAYHKTETGAGLLQDKKYATFKGSVTDICPYYYDLEPIIGDRAGSEPKVTSDDLKEGYDPVSEDDIDDVDDDDDDTIESSDGLVVCDDPPTTEPVSNVTDDPSIPSSITEVTKTASSSTSASAPTSTKKNKINPRGSFNRSGVSKQGTVDSVLQSQEDVANFKCDEMSRHNKVLEGIEHKKEEAQQKRLNQLHLIEQRLQEAKAKKEESTLRMSLLL